MCVCVYAHIQVAGGGGFYFLVPGSYPSLFYIIYLKSPKHDPNLLIIKYLCCTFSKVYSIDFDFDDLKTWPRQLPNLDMCKHIIKMAIT